MVEYIPFDPKKHKGLALFEEQGREADSVVEFVMVEADVPHEIAAMTPWYYFVEVEEPGD